MKEKKKVKRIDYIPQGHTRCYGCGNAVPRSFSHCPNCGNCMKCD